MRAVSVVGDGATASATSTPVTVSEAPASLNATPGDTQVTLDWTAPTSDGGSAVTGYEYRVSDDGGTSWSPDWTNVTDGSDSGTDRSDERSYTVTGLDNGVLHTFEVRAVSVVGDGATASATSTPVTVSEAPASLNATPGDTQVTLDWTAPTSDGGSAVTGYEYRVSDDGGTSWSPDWTNVPDGSDSGTDRSDERSYTVTGLDNGVEHTFEVRAVSVVGDGAPASATSTPVTVSEAPASLNATPGDTQVTLDWTVPTSDGGSAVTGYEYRVSDDDGTTWSPDWTNVPDGSDSGTDRSDERSYTVTGLDNGVEHTFEVRAVSVVGDGAHGLGHLDSGHLDSGHRPGAARQSERHSGQHAGEPGLDGSRLRRGISRDRVRVPGERRRRHLLESGLDQRSRRLRHRHRPQRREVLYGHRLG